MASDEEENFHAVRAKVESRGGSPTMGLDPGLYVYWMLSQHVVADEILFADWFCTPESEYSSRSGRIFAVTKSAVIIIDYENAVDEAPASQDAQEYGTASIQIYPRDAAVSITWNARNLYSQVVKLEASAITVSAEHWSQDLPFRRHTKDDAIDYFRTVCHAFGLM